MDQQTAEKISAIQDRIANDADFREQTEVDPIGTLSAAGLPSQRLSVGTANDVGGYMLKDGPPGNCICIWRVPPDGECVYFCL